MSVQLLSVLNWVELRVPLLQRVRRATAVARGLFVFAGHDADEQVFVHGAGLHGSLNVEGRGLIRVGKRCVFVGGPYPTTLHVQRDGSLEIAERCYFNYGSSIDVRHSVRMGDRCMFGSYVRISDAPGKPVVIGRQVWVAHGAVIQPGVTIGDGAVVSAGSVVTTDVPAGMLAMGNPARVMSQSLSLT
jgi:maltose O-acetyltransferase